MKTLRHLFLIMIATTLFNCSKNDDAINGYTLTIDVKYFSDITGKMMTEDGAEVYYFQNIQDSSDYVYSGNGYITNKITDQSITHTDATVTSTGKGVITNIPEGNHTVVVRSGKLQTWIIFKVNMNQDKSVPVEFK